ncbi:hypothetical protein V474_14785 [Novosphingobium barchaimii LL02]|uniref:ATP-grasp domain-containing protein n=1 Tax=Novosphingobium barchaimii LL02 TaxID=1114963 RepID=A0A0J7XYA0_9SPHN|nr:ATP-grasp domain-containing protein [Novosphingobium barchaimii]KMS56651.1 hypothetical protein V474_14785 [Novosphingobium barchaimii LL02]
MKIWFNQSFSMRNVVSRIVSERPSVSLLVSAIDSRSPVRDVAPVFWEEPARGTVDYAAWVLDTAMARGVEALVPQRGKRGVARMLDQFAANGIAVHVAADADTMELLDDKAAFAVSMAGDPYLCPTFAVTCAQGFEDAVQALTANGASACVKPSRGVYGAGYWTLDAQGPLTHLADPDARRISPRAYAAALVEAEQRGEAFSLLVMEHLSGLECSVDMVCERGIVLLAAVRTKLDANRQRIQTRHSLIAHAAKLVRRHGLHGAINVQYKQDRRGEWRILEINSRAAGGASYCDEVAIPFCTTWIDVVTGNARPFEAEVDVEIIAVTRAVHAMSALAA